VEASKGEGKRIPKGQGRGQYKKKKDTATGKKPVQGDLGGILIGRKEKGRMLSTGKMSCASSAGDKQRGEKKKNRSDKRFERRNIGVRKLGLREKKSAGWTNGGIGNQNGKRQEFVKSTELKTRCAPGE